MRVRVRVGVRVRVAGRAPVLEEDERRNNGYAVLLGNVGACVDLDLYIYIEREKERSWIGWFVFY